MLLTAIIFFIILSVLVLIHELGHFLVARFLGVGVEEFGLGLPPRVWGKKIKGTIYSINWLPIGGFVKLAGEDDGDESSKLKVKSSKLKQYFWARTKKERGAILIAGVAMNFLLAVGVTAYLLTQGVMEPAGRVHIERVLAGSPAEKAGLLPQDIVSSITYQAGRQSETKIIRVPSDLIEATRAHKGEPVTLEVVRQGEHLTISLVPRKEYPAGEGPMGVAISDLERRVYPLAVVPWEAVRINLVRGWEMFASLGMILKRLVTLQPLGADVAGPIGIAQVTGQAVKFGWQATLEFVSILSLNLAVLNILPIPALDGGRLAFVFLEKILGRKVKPAFEKSTHQVGMIILFTLILLVSINDILRLVGG